MASYDDSLSLLDARAIYFDDNDFGADGGYSKKWVKLEIGPIPLAIPNHPSRVRAVRIHDLHHVLTGYDTNFTGEAEISAFEIGAGCGDYVAAWLLNLSALFVGLFTNPRTVFAAYRRGRRCRSLYHEPFDEELLRESVGSVRTRQGLQGDLGSVSFGDCAGFAFWWCVSALVSLPVLVLLLSPVIALVWLLG